MEVPKLRHCLCTLPPRLGGGDVALRELTTEEVLNTPSASDRALLSLEGFRGARLPEGAEREEWWRGLAAPVTRLIIKRVEALNVSTQDETKAFEASYRVNRDGEVATHQWAIPGSLVGGAILPIAIRELRFGQVEDLLASAKDAKRKSSAIEISASAAGLAPSILGALPARLGMMIVGACTKVNSASEEEEEDFFASSLVSDEAPKLV